MPEPDVPGMGARAEPGVPGRGARAEPGLFSDGSAALGSKVGDPELPGKAPKFWPMPAPPIGLVGVSGVELNGDGGGSIGLVPPAAVPRAASALLDPSSKAAATKTEKVLFIGLPPSCVLPTQQRFRGRVPSVPVESNDAAANNLFRKFAALWGTTPQQAAIHEGAVRRDARRHDARGLPANPHDGDD
jgi:hypothetical protein